MKVGIYTITEGENYGNRLQNYALQSVLEKKGYRVRTLLDEYYKNDWRFKLKNSIKNITGIKKNRFTKRCEKFNRFNRKYIKFEREKINNNRRFKHVNKYECFVAGSDQIWNPNFEITTSASFLKFANNKKKIAVAASFGVSKIENNHIKKIYKDYLEEFNAISVREDSGAKIVEDLIGKEVPVLIDPTLMLSREEWDEIIRKPKKVPNGKYVFCYFLGEYEERLVNEINNYAKERNLEIVFLENEWFQLGVSSDDEFCIDPSEFVWLLKNSEKVITDSFHAAVFSVIYQREFITITRKSEAGDMSSRMLTLSKEFNIKNLITYNYDFAQTAKINNEYFNEVLKKKQCEFSDYLEKNLN